MAWKTIENVKLSTAKSRVPERGITMSSRRAMKGTRFLVLKIGAALAMAVRITRDEQQVRLMFGSGSDAGKICVTVDVGGGFVAKKQKSGSYVLTINRAAANGLFAMEFPAFTVDRVEAIRPENGQPPMFVFKASAEMLAVADD